WFRILLPSLALPRQRRKEREGGWRSDAEERHKTEEDRLREQEGERMEEGWRKVREEDQRRIEPGSGQTRFQQRLALVRRLYVPTAGSGGVAVLIALIVVIQ